MIELFETIRGQYDKAEADKLRTMTNGMFNGIAPEGTKFPFINYQVVDIVPGYFSTKGHIEECSVQFNLFDDESSQSRLLGVYDEFVKMFDDAELVVDGYGVVRLKRTGTIPLKEEDVWQLNVNYLLWLE